MDVLARAKKIDDAVLGRSDTTRGFVMNAMMGLHPMLAPLWLAAAGLGLVASVVLLVSDHMEEVPIVLAWTLVAATMGIAARRMPRRPPAD